MSNTPNFDRARTSRRSPRALRGRKGRGFLAIDDHGNSGDGTVGKFGVCTLCGRRNKVVTRAAEPVCVYPEAALKLPEAQRPATGCDAQRGPRPAKRRAS